MSNKHIYSTSDLNELTKELNRLRQEGYSVVKGPEFAENEYFVELERGGCPVDLIDLPPQPVATVVEDKPVHKPQRGTKPKKAATPTEA